MKRTSNSTKGLIKGAPAAVVVSIAIHAAILLLAGGLVVFHIVKKEAAKFVPPPPVERPKMDLKKPQVKVKKTTKPRSTQRITSKNVVSTPNIVLPEISTSGAGLSGGIGGYELMPDVSGLSVFGAATSTAVGNDFVGTFYSLSQTRGGRTDVLGKPEFDAVIAEFHESGWNPRAFARYYRAPNKLYTTHFCIPPFPEENMPELFGVQEDVETFDTGNVVIHYVGQMMSKKGGRYRFRAEASQAIMVRLNGEVVIEEHFNNEGVFSGWRSSAEENAKDALLWNTATVGDWFELEAGVPVEMEVLLTNYKMRAFWLLVIEDEDEEYPENIYGGPVLPIFRTAELPLVVRESIQYQQPVGMVELQSGEMFNIH